MLSFLTIKAHDIERWADTHKARECLPVLLRKLVHATGRDLARVDFPGFDNSQRQGWDGWVEAGMATAWIPEGMSGWEFGTSRDPRWKAESDYAKRLGLPLEERRQCTFVFVTPRNWPGKVEWAKQKEAAADDGWKAVRAYDASDLEQWLDESAVAPVWLAEMLPTPIAGVGTLEACWTKWALASEPVMTRKIFESTIAACVEPFKKWLERPPQRPFVVAADSTDEALAFLACLFEHNEIPAAQRDLAAVFTSSETLTTLAASLSPFIPIAGNDETQESLAALCRRMHCIATCPRNAVDVDTKPDVTLDLLGCTAFEEALADMGLDRHEAPRLARESGRSPTILRRRLSLIPNIRTPRWADDTTLARHLIPMCLAGAWHVHTCADQEVIATLAGCKYEEVERHVARLRQIEDCPVWSDGQGQHRGLTSKVDVLFAVAPSMTEQDINDFLTLAEYVLSESDPALDLPEEDRWAANIHGKVRDHSAALRNGICETLVLLSVHGNDLFQERLGIDVEGQISNLVARLLMPLGEKLQSQKRDLPAYAEAAPERFLEILEEDLRKEEPVVLRLLKPASSQPFAHPARTGFLWALECVAWNPDYLSRVSVLLAELSRTEIDDNWADRPIGSLAGILRSWMPQTAAPVAKRIEVLQMLAERFPAIGWQLCLGEIRAGPRVAMDNNRPRWRSDAAGAGGVATEDDCLAVMRCAASVLLSWPKHDQTTLGDLVEQIEALPEDQQSAVWDLIDAWAQSQSDDEAKAELRERIRRFALTKRGRRNLPATNDKARLAYDRLQPRTLLARHASLFANRWFNESWDEIEDEELDYQARNAKIDRLRQAAMRDIWGAHGLAGALTMVERGSDGHTVGRYAALCTTDAAGVLRECLSCTVDVAEIDAFMRAFIGAHTDFAESDLLLDVSQQVDREQSVRLWRCAPFQAKTWRMLDRLPAEVHDRYWRTVSPDGWRLAEAECTEIVDRLLAAKRPQAAFAAVAHQWDQLETGCLKRLLMALASGDAVPEDMFPIELWSVSDALDALEARPGVSLHEMARLEFDFIEALNHSEHGIPNLERLIGESPELFVEVLSCCFKRRDDGQDPMQWQIEDEDAADRRQVAENAYSLLDRVARIPGTDDDGTIQSESLLHWLRRSRELCAQFGRTAVGDIVIGEILSKAPPDEDGAWPCSAVCEALETVASEDVAEGFRTGKLNARGMVARSGQGGDQERELAAQYRRWAQQRRVDYPFARSVIHSIAQWYDDDAKRQDARAALDKRLNT